jgi:hypothetical protein
MQKSGRIEYWRDETSRIVEHWGDGRMEKSKVKVEAMV